MWVSKDRSLSVLFNAATGFDMDSDHIWDPFPKGTQPKNLKKKLLISQYTVLRSHNTLHDDILIIVYYYIF